MKVSIQDFCQDFYDSQIFHPVIAGQDMKYTYIDTVYDSALEKDSAFQSVDRNKFRSELLALRTEIFSLAFQHKVKKDKLILEQTMFTKDYLQQNNETNIWEIMLPYNQAIAQSGYEIVSGEKMKRGWDVFLNTYKMELLKKWESKGIDSDSSTMVANRYGTEVAWDRKITVKRLTARLADRVGCIEKINQETLLVLASAIWGFYQGAKDALKSIKFK